MSSDMSVDVVLTRPDAVFPTRAHPTDAGFDLTVVEKIGKLGNDVCLYDTGVRVSPPHGYHTEIVPRSSISKTGYALANSIGIIDNSYRGNLLIALRKVDPKAPTLQLPARIGQLIVRRTEPVSLRLADDLDSTERGEGGFGSSGN